MFGLGWMLYFEFSKFSYAEDEIVWRPVVTRSVVFISV